MREVVYRLWDKKNKKMIYSDGEISYIDDDGMEHLAQRVIFADMWGNVLIYRHSTGGTDEIELIDDGVILQFTGLEDKYGGKIYENDIVFMDDGSKRQVFFDGGCFMPFMFSDSEECEVIGNIYENPELLERVID